LTFELDLDSVKMNQRAEYLGQGSFRSKVTDGKSHKPDCVLSPWTSNVVGKNNDRDKIYTTLN